MSKKKKKLHQRRRHRVLAICIGLVLVITVFAIYTYRSDPVAPTTSNNPQNENLVPYVGKIYHIFFHSLIVYPQLAINDPVKGSYYDSYMITQKDFKKILQTLYDRHFILIDIHSIYNVDEGGRVSAKTLYLPPGTKPLILSLDDLNYYSYMKGKGFADKLVLDGAGKVATEIVTPEGKTEVTRDGDVVPIVDDFVAGHPDFSLDGAKGTIALTGFEGILGYRTQATSSTHYYTDLYGAKRVIAALKISGWNFASHSYTHDHVFLDGTITLNTLKNDTDAWLKEVGSLVGPSDVFIGPFGQIFGPSDPRREYLISQGFHMLGGVGMDIYLHYFPDSVVMDRADIDGIRLHGDPALLKDYFDPHAL